jgi:hypothetical protein
VDAPEKIEPFGTELEPKALHKLASGLKKFLWNLMQILDKI